VWKWGEFPCAHLFASADGKRVYDVANAAMAIRRGTPLRYQLVHRHAMIDYLARDAKRIVELASGLSSRGAAMSADPSVHYVEIDLPGMIAHKRGLLERTAEGKAVLARGNFELVAGDMATMDLAPYADGPTFVIAEGIAMYLDSKARRALFARIAQMAGEIRLVLDLVPTVEEPRAGLTGRLLEIALKRFTGGWTFERDARTRQDVLGELRDSGFEHAEAIAVGDVARAWQLPHAERKTPIVVFSARASRASRS
jgi:O-methyltransferase involved in polyketide biosynthesis